MSIFRSVCWASGILLMALAAASIVTLPGHAQTAQMAGAAGASGPPVNPMTLASQEDRQKMMDLLHIATLRRGADGNNKQSPFYANYDESKANPYPVLPDPLVMKNGRKVTTAAMWPARRAEIVEDFDREIYGRVPAVTPKVTWEVVKVANEKNGDVPVITKTLLGHVDNSAYPAISVNIQLSLSTPANATGPVPVILYLGGNAPGFPGPAFGFGAFGGSGRGAFGGSGRGGFAFGGAGRGRGPTGPSWQQQVLAKGWGYATIGTSSVQADNGAGLTQGIIGLVNKGQPRKPDDWGALRAWAWGCSRALDYFETDKAVNAKMVGQRLHTDSFDLALFDIHMPGINGLETCQNVRARSQASIVMLDLKGEGSFESGELPERIQSGLGGTSYPATGARRYRDPAILKLMAAAASHRRLSCNFPIKSIT